MTTNSRAERTGESTASREFNRVDVDVDGFLYGAGRITSAYQMRSGEFVCFCQKTGEWLKYTADKSKVHVNFGHTREAASRLTGEGDGCWVEVKPFADRKYYVLTDGVSCFNRRDFNAEELVRANAGKGGKTYWVLDNVQSVRRPSFDACPLFFPNDSIEMTPRHINIAAITDDGRMISQQVWTKDVEDAHKILSKWLDDEKFSGRICLAMISDPVTGRTSLRRHGEKLYALEVQP